ncbi:MAG: hypothetical protein J4N30_05670, partial [Chloroflexi bacterium]|nr:hypothetical protein [Chloroflexota bacterium]
MEEGKLRFAWVIGTTWIQAMAASGELARKFLELTVENPNQVTSANVDAASNAPIRRADSGGMVIVDQDIYLQNSIGKQMADLVLPA